MKILIVVLQTHIIYPLYTHIKTHTISQGVKECPGIFLSANWSDSFFPVGALSPVGDLIGWLVFLLLCYSLNGWQPRGRQQLASSISSLAKCLENAQGGESRDCFGFSFYFIIVLNFITRITELNKHCELARSGGRSMPKRILLFK